MRYYLLNLLARGWRRVRGVSGLATEPTRANQGGPRNDARARFWTEFREGQREADARSGRPRP